MKKIIISLSLAVFILFPNVSFSGQRCDELLWALTGQEKMAFGYINGVVDTIAVLPAIDPLCQVVCLPQKGISIDQAIRIVVKYLKNHPEDLHYPARTCVYLAISKAFPCEK